MSDVSTMNHSLMCECGHVSGGHYYNPSLSGFDRCINCECKQFRLSCFEPTQTSPERAELQVSLLNEIGLTLTAVARAMAEQAETLKTYKLSLEGIQGLLVELDAKLDAHDGHLTAIDIVSSEGTQRILKERGERLDRIEAALEGIKGLIGDSKHAADERWNYALRGQASQLKGNEVWERLVTRLDLILGVLGKRDSQVGRKPRKAGKRPAHKAKVTHKTR